MSFGPMVSLHHGDHSVVLDSLDGLAGRNDHRRVFACLYDPHGTASVSATETGSRSAEGHGTETVISTARDAFWKVGQRGGLG